MTNDKTSGTSRTIAMGGLGMDDTLLTRGSSLQLMMARAMVPEENIHVVTSGEPKETSFRRARQVGDCLGELLLKRKNKEVSVMGEVTLEEASEQVRVVVREDSGGTAGEMLREVDFTLDPGDDWKALLKSRIDL